MKDPDDAGRPFVARFREAELLHEIRIAGAPRHRRRPCMRHVCQQRPERDHHLHAELAHEPDDEIGERLPAEIRLDPEQEHDVVVEPVRPSVVEGGLRPLDLPSHPALQRDVRAGRLEVEELLGIDVREPLRLPGLGEVARGQRGCLRAIVPAAECGDQNRARELRPLVDSKLAGHGFSLRAARFERQRRTPQDRDEGDENRPNGRC